MCTRDTKIKCLICNESLNSNTNRIIVEICGHKKCRQCFIKEENGCTICNRNKNDTNSDNNKPANEEILTKPLPMANLSVDEQIAFTSNDSNLTTTIDSDKKIEVIENFLINPINDELLSPKSQNDIHLIAKNTSIDRAAVSHITVIRDGNNKAISYLCTICQKSFKSRNNQKYHYYCDGSQTKPFACDQCNKQFITFSHLQYHQKTHTNHLHQCEMCDKIYLTEIGLLKHMRKHKNEYKYQCNQCDQQFLHKEQLNAHENRHNNKFQKCPECSMQFLLKSNLTKHILSHSGKNQKTCSMCKKTYSGTSALKTHMLTHSKLKPFQCKVCAKNFIDQRTLERHAKIHSANIFYECTLCSAKSGRKDNIRRHVRNLHANSDSKLQTILNTIFDNYANRYNTDVEHNESKQKTELETIEIESVKSIKNIATSVIKFAGKSTVREVNEVFIALESSSPLKEYENDVDRCNSNQKNCQNLNSTNLESHIVQNNVECDLLKIYQPLTLDPLPQMKPLPLLTTNTNSNLSIYRQLLSPYLKRSTTQPLFNADGEPIDAIKSTIIVRPPKKMVVKLK